MWDLGDHTATYRPARRAGRGELWAAVLAFAVPGLAALSVGHFAASLPPWILFGLASAYLWRVRKHSGWQLDIFRQGLIVTVPRGQPGVFRWDSSVVLQNAIPRSRRGLPQPRYGYVLIDRGGFAISFGRGFSRRTLRRIEGVLAHTVVRGPAFPGSEHWGSAIHQGMLAAHLPTAFDAIRDGRTVCFGNSPVLYALARQLPSGPPPAPIAPAHEASAAQPKAPTGRAGWAIIGGFTLGSLLVLVEDAESLVDRFALAPLAAIVVGFAVWYVVRWLRKAERVAYALGGSELLVALWLAVGLVVLGLVVILLSLSGDPLAIVPMIAVGSWVLVLVERRVRDRTAWIQRHLTDLVAVVVVAIVLSQLFNKGLTFLVAAGLFFPVSVWLCLRTWRGLARSRRLLIRAGADIVLSLLLGLVVALLVVWLANVLQLSPRQVETIHALLNHTKPIANVRWAYWLVAYVLLATATFTTLRWPAGTVRMRTRIAAGLRQWAVHHVMASAGSATAQAERILNRELMPRTRPVPIAGGVDVGRRILTVLNLGLMVALLFGITAQVAVTPMARQPVDARYVLELGRQRQLAGQIAAYAEIRRTFTADPSATKTLSSIVLAVHLIDPPSIGRPATETALSVARQLGRFQSAALDVDPPELPPIPRPPDTGDLSSQVEQLHRQQRTTTANDRLVNQLAHQAAVAVAGTLQIPNVGESEAVQIIREYLIGLVEDGPLKDVFYAWSRRLTPSVPRRDIDAIVVPDAAELRSAARAATVEAAELADAELPSVDSELTDVTEAVQLANQYRYLREETGSCPGCAKAGDRHRDTDLPDIFLPGRR